MFKQSVSLVEFSELYKILYEIKNLITFNIYNYQNTKDFISEIKLNNTECINSTFIIEKKNKSLLINNKINKNNILIFDKLPLRIDKVLDKINTHLIKQKYNFQSNVNIKEYILNLNSRIISKKEVTLKLTEKEIDIILFLNRQNIPQSINKLQSKVWGHTLELETHTVETHIYRLRKKIKEKFDDNKFIISLDEGYLI